MKKHKNCEICRRRMRRRGKTAAGTERYLCLVCEKTSIVHRKDTHARHDEDRLMAWLTGVDSKNEVAKRYGITRRALTKEFRSFFRKDLEFSVPTDLKIEILIVDAKYIHGNQLCVLVALTQDNQIFWRFADQECYAAWYEFLIRFPAPRIVVADGQKGMKYFAKRYWPDTAFQRCHFHLVALGIHYLSRNPKEEAGQEILKLLYELKHIKTPDQKKRWLQFHFIWEKMYLKVFNEKTESGGYKYRKLRSVRIIIRRAIPNLFTYLDYPGCPNTTNLVEGWINTAIAEGLRRHRGLKSSQKKTLVSVILSNLSRNSKEKNTRKFP